MAFIVKNTAFECFFCGEENPPAERTCRNHCRKCLSAVHLDEKFPGDRASICHGEMKISEISPHPKHDFTFEHTCIKCNKTIKNKSADDDSRQKIFEFLEEKARREFLG